MRVVTRALIVLSLTSCGEQAQFEQKCQKLISARCERDIDCAGGVGDYEVCRQSFESTWMCDPEASLEDMDECIRQLDVNVSPCGSENNLMPLICYDVLCSAAIGCLESTADPTTPPIETY